MAFTEIVSSGMTVSGEIIDGKQIIEAGGIVKDSTIIHGGVTEIKSGGLAEGMTANSVDGEYSVHLDGGKLKDSTINDGCVYGNGDMVNVTLNGGWAQIYTGSTADGLTLIDNRFESAQHYFNVTNLKMENSSMIRDLGGSYTVASKITMNDSTFTMFGTFTDLTATGDSVVAGAGKYTNITLDGSDCGAGERCWAQIYKDNGETGDGVAGPSAVTNLKIFGNAKFEAMDCFIKGAEIVGKAGQKYEIGKTRNGSELLLFSVDTNVAEDVTLKAGGSAHIYDGGTIRNVTVENGGVLYLTNWGLSGTTTGHAEGVTVKNGGALWIGGDASSVNGTVEKGGQLWGLKASQIVDLQVWDSATNKYQTYSWEGYTYDITIYAGVHFEGTGRASVFEMTGLNVDKGGFVSQMWYKDKVDGTFEGKAYSFDGKGKVSNWVVQSGCVLFGDINKYTAQAENVNLVDVEVLTGGILDGFRTGRAGDGTPVSKGTYVNADGSKVQWSFGNGTAKNVVINSGCFVIQGISAAGATDAGSTDGLVINDGIVVIANGSKNTNMTISGKTAMQIYGAAELSGTNKNFAEGDDFNKFTVANGVASNLVIANGGFYYGFDGQTIQDSVITGSRSVASGNAESAKSTLQLSAGSTADNVVVEDGAQVLMKGGTLKNSTVDNASVALTGNIGVISNVAFVNGASTSFGTDKTGEAAFVSGDLDITFENGKTVSCKDGVLSGYQEGGNFFIAGDIKVKDMYLKNLTYNNLWFGGTSTVDGLTIDCTNDWGCNIKSNNAMTNVTVKAGWMDLDNNITGLIVDGRSIYDYMATNGADRLFKDVKVNKGGLFIGQGKTDWSEAAVSYLENVVLTAGSDVTLRNGTITDIFATDSTISMNKAKNATDWIFKGKLELTNSKLMVGYRGTEDAENAGSINLDLTDVTSFKLKGSTIYTNVIGGDNVTAYLSGANGGFGGKNAANYSMEVNAVVFDMTSDWFLADGAWNAMDRIYTNSWSFVGRLGQGDYNLGNLMDAFKSLDCTFGGKKVTMSLGGSTTIDGYTIKFSQDANGNGIFTVRADESSNTALDWTTAWNKSYKNAVKYVNDIAGDGATIYLGNTMENKGGNAVNNAFGTLSTGAIVNDNVKNSTIFGGSSTQKIGTSWVKVTGGTKNTIYGGGDGQDMTDGTNVQVTGGTTSKIFGAGKNSVTSVGVNNAYAVNMDVVGGSHKQIYGGSDGGSVVGDITLLIENIKLSQMFAGGGTGNVDGDITTTMYGIDDKASAWTANVFGGSSAIAKDTTVTGDIQLKINGGFYQGLILGGSRSQNTVSTFVEGDITLTVKNTVQFDNVKLLASGTSAWIIGAGQAVNGGKLTVETVNVNLSASTLANVVGGAQAEGTSVATVGNVNVNVGAGSEITANIFVAGYARGGATSNVTGDVNLTVDASVGSVAIQGNIYAGGNNPGGKGVVKVDGDATIEFTGSGDNLTFTGVVSGLGKGNCEVTGKKIIEFNNFTGDFSGTIESFDLIGFGSDTVMTMSNGFTTAQVGFDVSNRTETDLFITGDDSIVLEGDQRFVNLIIGNGEFNFDLMETTEDEMTGVIAKIFDADGVELGTFDLMTEKLIVDGVEVSFDLNNGILSANGTKGLLA